MYVHMYVYIYVHEACDTLPDGNYICSPEARRVVLKASSICGLHMLLIMRKEKTI